MGSSRFSDGFLIGAMAGGALVFLLGTKKGNEVLKLMMEEGRASIGDLMDGIEEYKEEMKNAQATEEVVAEVKQDSTEKTQNTTKQEVKEAPAQKNKSSKRFFKKSK